ncbi:MAG TPA: hypothetical protein VNH65_16830 [Candidatus Acidoferrum sp.]|nr:hypothetical protein [Candidatus Acidoferrum sp.]
MPKARFLRLALIGFVFAGVLGLSCVSFAQTSVATLQVQTSVLDRRIKDFLHKEITAHVADIKTLDPPPERVVGALTIGEFSWGTFMRTLGSYSEFAGTTTIAGRDVSRMIGSMAKIELDHGGKTWAQLYAAMALESFGKDLNHNALWQGLTSEERKTYLALLDPGRFYDAKNHVLLHLPENYFGVAARIAAIDYELGLHRDRASLDDLLNQAAKQFTAGALFADDALPTGRFDRYSNEYVRALYDAAELAGRLDLIKALSPSLKDQMKLWWDLLSPDGYGYSWGRSLGAISYMDTMEISAFLGKHPEFRPAPLSDLASAYFAAWTWLRSDYNDQTHLLSIFAFGRGDYGYITKEREWQQTTTFFGKLISAHQMFMSVLEKEGVKTFASRPNLSNVARFEYFRNGTGRKFGVWIVRQGSIQFAMPFVTGPKAATSDYEPAPYGFPGFAVPVEQIYPCLVAFLELEDGRIIAPVDGADDISPAEDGKTVTAVWKHWALVGTKAGETVDPDLVSEVTWSLRGDTLHRVETLSSSKGLRVRRLWLAIPSRENHLETLESNGARTYRLDSTETTLDVVLQRSDWPIQVSVYATGNGPLGRGDRGPIPLHLILESKNIALGAAVPRSWEITLAANSKKNSGEL